MGYLAHVGLPAAADCRPSQLILYDMYVYIYIYIKCIYNINNRYDYRLYMIILTHDMYTLYIIYN